VILTLTWKEYREHRSIWLAMVVMTGLLSFGMASLISPRSGGDARLEVVGLTVLGMAAAYGLVCGGMMFAGEREAGTLVFLDIFLGRRGLLWFWKLVIGLVWVLTEALAVALLLHLLKQDPPPWLRMLIGIGPDPAEVPGAFRSLPPASLWFIAVPLVTLEAYAWGLLGSSLTRRVLSGAALATLMIAPLWLLTIFTPPPVFLGIRLITAGMVLFFSLATFLSQSRETLQGPPPRTEEPHPLRRRLRDWEGGRKFELERRAPEGAWGDRPLPDVDLVLPVVATVATEERVVRRGRRPAQANSHAQVLWWLTFRQAWLVFGILAAVAGLAGLLLPLGGQVLWPVGTLLLGVACGTAAFAPEQSDLSYQFLGAQHLPLRKFWGVKILFWFAAAVLLALVFLAGGGLALLGKALFAARPHDLGPGADPWQAAPPPPPDPAPSAGFAFGPLAAILGPVSFFGPWLLYGFCTGQLFVLFCRKAVLAVLLASVVGAAALGLWLPSLLCQGMGGWQVWLPPLALLAATRFLMRAWVGGRIKEWKPLAAVAGFGLAALAWVGVNYGFRAWEVPDVGQPMDRTAFRASVPAGRSNPAGQKIQEALGELEDAKGNVAVWRARLAEADRLPAGVLESPPADGPSPTPRYLPACKKMTDQLRVLAAEALKQPRPAFALEHLAQLAREAGKTQPILEEMAQAPALAQAAVDAAVTDPAVEPVAQILALSRTLRNKAPLASYQAGVEAEASALDALDLWLAAGKPAPGRLAWALEVLNRHAAQTPPPLDCLRAECNRAAGVLNSPINWTFHPGPGTPGLIRQAWLADGIALSLETPWEKERRTRLWRVVWAGLFRALETPYWELPGTAQELVADKWVTGEILRGWLPAADGPGASLTAARLARLLDASWLSDERLFAPVVPLRAAATRARWRLDSCRLRVALALYRLREGKPARTLEALVPGYLPQLPGDPYSGQAFRYRVAQQQEHLEFAGDEPFEGKNGPDRGHVQPGQGILWSTGPDRVSHDGRHHGGGLADDDPRWANEGLDLIAVVPYWP
jgi:hypothetical protein